jgi:crossover junction endodeoxyribonuclease RuvC
LRILGIDPGLQLTGYGCVELRRRAREPVLVEAGVLRLKPRASLAFRLAQLHGDLAELLDELRPDVMVVEKLFSHYRHARTAIIMGHARGVVLLAGELRGIHLQEMAPTEIKRAVTGFGHASKNQVQRAVMNQCGLAKPPQPPDVADAIAIALCAARRLAPTTAAAGRVTSRR